MRKDSSFWKLNTESLSTRANIPTAQLPTKAQDIKAKKDIFRHIRTQIISPIYSFSEKLTKWSQNENEE